MKRTSRLRIICVGKIKKLWVQEGINMYLKRIPNLTITEIRDSFQKKEESAILSSTRKNEEIILLSEYGKNINSINFSNELIKDTSKNIAFLISGSNGFSLNIQSKADKMISLSSMTFPHEIARLLLIEQIYRAQTIQQGSPYHRE